MGLNLRFGHRARHWPAVLLGVALCTQAAATATPQAMTPPPATTPRSPAHLSLPEAPEKRLVEQHCVACHDIVRVENAGGSRSGWTRRLRRMILRGATLPPQDIPVLAEYLARSLPERLRIPETGAQPTGAQRPVP